MKNIDIPTKDVAEQEAFILKLADAFIVCGSITDVAGHIIDEPKRRAMGQTMMHYGNVMEENSFLFALVVCLLSKDDLKPLYDAPATESVLESE
jgi:hypothetical protein